MASTNLDTSEGRILISDGRDLKPRKAFLWSVTGQLVSFTVNFASSIILARLLSPIELGIYVIGTATVGLIAAFTSLGVGTYVIREPNLTDEILDTAFTLNALLAAGLAVVILLIGEGSRFLLGSTEAGNVLRVLAVTPALGILTFRPATLLQREGNFKAISLVTTTAMVIGTAITVACAWAGLSYMSPAWGGLVAALVTLVGYCIAGRRYLSFSVGLAGGRAILVFGLRMVTISGSALMTARLADIIMGRLLGLKALGLYSRASNLSNQIFDNIYGTATRVVFVQMSSEYRKSGEIKAVFIKSFRMITAVMWPLLLGLAILSPVLVYLLYGDKWASVAPPLSILLVAQVVAMFFGMNWELFVIKNETALQTRIELSRSALGLAVFMIGCMVSVTAAAAGRLCDNIIALFLYRKHVARLSEASTGELNRIYREGMVLSVAAVAPTALLMVRHHWSEHAPLPFVFLAVGLGIALWVACLIRFRHPLIDEAHVLMVAIGRRRARLVSGE